MTANGDVVQLELSSGDFQVPGIPRTGLAYVLLRWKGAPVGRLIIEGDRPLSEAAFRSAALETAAAGIVAVEAERAAESLAAMRVATTAESPAAESLATAAETLAAGPVATAAESLATAAGRLSPRPGMPTAMPSSDVSVIIATRNRPEDLSACLEALAALDPSPGEIVVVDSASSSPAEIAAAAARPRVRVVRLDRPGLSRARNAGALAATGRVLAFLDDDCRVDAGWLANLCAGFSDDGVQAVTGQLLPFEIQTEAQIQFLRYSHMDRRGFAPRRFERTLAASRYWPIDAWRMGSGGNLAVREDAFRRLGGFQLSLGLGTPARGGEDMYLLWSLVESGGAVVYRPGAMAWHRHHRTGEALRRVLFGYGAGHAAYLRAIRRAGAPRRALMLYRLSFCADRLARLARSLAGHSPVPSALVLRELAGSLAGGFMGRKAEREAAREKATSAKVRFA